jgi:ABC-type microcin C transport system permease subunit YejE
MVRTIIVSYSNNAFFPIPQEYVGMKLEVIAFPLEDDFKEQSIRKEVVFTDFGLNALQYKFDREEANAR